MAKIIDLSIGELSAIESVVLIDVREADEFEDGTIPGAENMPLSEIMQNPKIFEQDTDKQYVLFCQKGIRSQKACEILIATGAATEDIHNLLGGYSFWMSYQS